MEISITAKATRGPRFGNEESRPPKRLPRPAN
jgi:hypothetical protein